MSIKVIQKNKKAYFNYEILEELEVGISLVGTEVKSIREGRCSFSDSYIVPKNGSLVLIGFLIQPYSHGNIFNHKTDRNRVLLAHRQEIRKFTRKVNERGFTIVPLEIYLKDNLDVLKGYGLVVHPRCVHLIEELTRYSYKVDPLTGEIGRAIVDRDNHIIDSLRYAFDDVIRNRGTA